MKLDLEIAISATLGDGSPHHCKARRWKLSAESRIFLEVLGIPETSEEYLVYLENKWMQMYLECS